MKDREHDARRSSGPSFAPLPAEDREQIKALEQEIANLQEEITGCEQEARRLQARETAGEGLFPSEIFALKQRKMTLATEIQHRKVRINHLLWSRGA